MIDDARGSRLKTYLISGTSSSFVIPTSTPEISPDAWGGWTIQHPTSDPRASLASQGGATFRDAHPSSPKLTLGELNQIKTKAADSVHLYSYRKHHISGCVWYNRTRRGRTRGGRLEPASRRGVAATTTRRLIRELFSPSILDPGSLIREAPRPSVAPGAPAGTAEEVERVPGLLTPARGPSRRRLPGAVGASVGHRQQVQRQLLRRRHERAANRARRRPPPRADGLEDVPVPEDRAGVHGGSSLCRERAVLFLRKPRAVDDVRLGFVRRRRPGDAISEVVEDAQERRLGVANGARLDDAIADAGTLAPAVDAVLGRASDAAAGGFDEVAIELRRALRRRRAPAPGSAELVEPECAHGHRPGADLRGRRESSGTDGQIGSREAHEAGFVSERGERSRRSRSGALAREERRRRRPDFKSVPRREARSRQV